MNDQLTDITLGDIERLMEERGVSLSEIKGFRISALRRGDRDSPMFLEVKRYLTNEKGERFLIRWPTTGNHVVAYEILRFPLVALAIEAEATKVDPMISYEDEWGVTRRKRASQITTEQMQMPRPDPSPGIVRATIHQSVEQTMEKVMGKFLRELRDELRARAPG